MTTIILDSSAIINTIKNNNYDALDALINPPNRHVIITSTVYGEIVQGGLRNSAALQQIDRELESSLRDPDYPGFVQLETTQLPSRAPRGSRDAGEISIAHVLNGGQFGFLGAEGTVFTHSGDIVVVSNNLKDFRKLELPSNVRVITIEQHINELRLSGDLTPAQDNAFHGDYDFSICFPAGTPILMWNSTQKNIEDIKPDQLVSSYLSGQHSINELADAADMAGRVVRTFNNITEDWIEVHFIDPSSGEGRTLTATPGHVMLTPDGSFKQLVQMLEPQSDDPDLSNTPTDVQRLGGYVGSVRLVLADSQIITAQAWSIRYCEATAHLYEEAEMLVTRTEGGLAVQPEVKRGWKTYNFEVEKYHTYIAGGVRVHNMSEHVGQAYGNKAEFVGSADIVRDGLGGQFGDLSGYDKNGNIVHYSASDGTIHFTHTKTGVTYRENKNNTMMTLADDDFRDGVDQDNGTSSPYEYNVGSWHFDPGHVSSPYNPDYDHSQVVPPGTPDSLGYPTTQPSNPNGQNSGGSNSGSGSSSGGPQYGTPPNPVPHPGSSGSSGNQAPWQNQSGNDGSVAYGGTDQPYTDNAYSGGGGNNGGGGGGGGKPVLFDLDDDGLEVSELDSSTVFWESIDDGLSRKTAWADQGDAVLFFDEDGNDAISSTREFVFTEWDPTSASDLDALKSVFDTNDDGKLTTSDDDWAKFKLAVTGADGSITTKTLTELGITEIDLTGNATHIELPDGSVITGTTAFTYSDGSTGTAGELTLRTTEKGYDIDQVESVNQNGDRVQNTTAYAADGSIAFTIESTIASDGSSTINRYDVDGDGVVDQVQTITIATITGGTQKDEALYRGTDVASGILLEATRTTKIEAAGMRTETIERDSSGGGWYDQVEVRTTSLADDSLTITVTEKAQDGMALAILTKTVSADGLTRTEELDVDADGAFEEKLVHQITIDPVTSARTETTTRYNPDGSVRDVTTETVSADGQTRSVASDADGNAANETTVATAITVNVDGSTSSQFNIYNEDGSLRSSQTHNQSDDALEKTIASDLDGDGTTDLTETNATVLAVDGSRTQTITQLNGDGSLLSKRETWLAENRIETTTHVDLDRDGTFDADEILEDVSLYGVTGEVTAKSYVRAVDGTVLAEETRVTSADGLTTNTKVDADGDGDDDSVIDDVTTINGDGSSTQVITIKNGDGSVRSTVTKWVSADGLTARIDTDSDGNGVLDQVDHVVQVNNVDGSTTSTTQSFAGDGTTLLASSTTDHSADRRTTTVLTDSNGDGANDVSSVRIEAIDGSVTLTEAALNEDGGVAHSTTTTVSADGLTSVVYDDMDGDSVADKVVRSTTVHNLDGSRTDTVRTENSDGSLRTEQVLTISDDGHATTLQEDEDGDGIIERTVTTTRSYDADGTERTVEVLTATNGAVLNRVQTLVSDDGLTTDLQLDADGDGVFDLTTRSVTTLQPNGSSVELVETRDATNALRSSTSVTTSDDGRVQTVASDLDGDGNTDRIEQTVIADDGSVTTTRSDYNPDGSLQSQTQSITNGTGLVAEERFDQDGDGTFEKVDARNVVLNIDGSMTTTTQTQSDDGTKSYEEVVTLSDDERQMVTATDVDGDCVVDFITTDTMTLATNGVTTVRSETRSRDATLIAVTETVTSADGDTVTETMDWNGDGQTDAVTTTTVGFDGEVNTTTITYAANGTVEGSHTVKTSDDGLTQTIEHDVLDDGQIDLTKQDVSVLQADGGVKRTVTHTDQAGQMLAQEEYLTGDDGLSSIISTDLDGDGVDDLIEQIDFETKLDGSTERTSSTTDGAASLLARTVTIGSADGLTETVSTDLDGDGQNDRVDTMVMGADGGYVQTIQTFGATGTLTSSRTTTLSADERSEQRDFDLDGDGVRDQAMSRTLNADQSTTMLYSDVDGATTKSAITRTVEAKGLDSLTTYDLDGDGSAEFTRSFTTEFAADGSETRTLMDTADTGQRTYEEIRTIDADGLTTTTTYDHDGDGQADTTKLETIVINDDGSRTHTTRSTYADGTLHSETISDTSYDGKSRDWRTDRDGNGVIDKEIQVTIHADGERVETITTYNAVGTVISTSSTTTSSDGLSVVTVRDDTTETITHSPTNTDSYTWDYDITLPDGTYEVTSEHKADHDGNETWTYTKVYSTWQQGSTYTPDASDAFLVDTRTNSQIKTENGWTQWLVTEVTETRLDEQTKQRLFDDAAKLYDTILDRDLNNSEHEQLIGYTVDGLLDLDTLAKELRESEEFVIRFGENLSDADYVHQLYLNTFGRPPTMVELGSNLASLDGQTDPWSGVSDPLDRDGLAVRLAQSVEHELVGNTARFTDNYDAVEPADGSGDGTQVPSDFERYQDRAVVEAQVKGLFHTLYDRDPTITELDDAVVAYLATDEHLDWVATYLIDQNYDAGDANTISALTGSALINQAFLNAFGRTPSQQEHDAWVDMLANGTLTKAQFIGALAEHAVVNTLIGTDGDDVLTGAGGDDTIIGNSGDDVLIGGAGADVLDGGAGIDTASYSTASSAVYIHMGDTVQNTSDAAGDSYTSIEVVEGTAFDDTLIGDVTFSGGAGADTIYGTSLTGQTISGGDGNDVIHADDGDDTLDGGSGDDTVIGYSGDDLITLGAGDDYSAAGDGHDTIDGEGGHDEIRAGSGNDALTGRDGDDSLHGEDGDDIIDFGTGDDYAAGGAGNDTFIFRSGYGYDEIGDFESGAGIGDVVEIDVALAADFSALQALMTDWGGPHTFLEFGGGDTLMFYDTAIVELHADDFRFVGGVGQPGTPTSGNDVLTGTSNSDVIDGLAGDDTIIGNSGDDVLIGGAGSDVLDGGSGIDTASYSTATAAVYIHMQYTGQNTGDAAGDSYTSIEVVEGTAFDDTLIGDVTLSGGAGADTIYGTSLAGQTISGGDGNDVIHADDGADVLDGGSGDDTVIGYAGDDLITLGDGDDYSAAGDGNDTIDGGAGADEIRAGSGDDTLTGGDGDDSLHGDDGDDIIDFGLGDDYATGGAGNDTFIFRSGYGYDEIGDFESGVGTGDVVEIDTALAADFSALQTFLTDWGGPNTFLEFGNGDTLVFYDTAMTDLHADDFRFVA